MKGPVNSPFEVEAKLTLHQLRILVTLAPFYTESRVREVLLPLTENRAPISLRALDWLVTNYSKKHNVLCLTRAGEPFNVHQGYKIALEMHKRRNFDPFRRRPAHVRVQLGDKVVHSTVGQLQFMHWAFCNGVLAYAYRHVHDIESDMNATTRAVRALKSRIPPGAPRQRAELSRAPRGRCMVYSSSRRVVL